jgi:hypothetical protein
VLIIARLLEIVSPSLSFIENSIVPLLQSASDDPKTPPEVGPLVEVFARLLDARVLLVAQSEAEVHDCSLLPVIGTGPLLLSLLLCLWLSGHILVALLALVVIDILFSSLYGRIAALASAASSSAATRARAAVPLASPRFCPGDTLPESADHRCGLLSLPLSSLPPYGTLRYCQCPVPVSSPLFLPYLRSDAESIQSELLSIYGTLASLSPIEHFRLLLSSLLGALSSLHFPR